jgi:hypothetical protein
MEDIHEPLFVIGVRAYSSYRIRSQVRNLFFANPCP